MATSTLTDHSSKNSSTGKKLLASATAIGAAAAVAGLGTWGEFGGSTNASQAVASGSAGLEMPYTTLNQPISGMLPGDIVERYATLKNPGTSNLREVSMFSAVVGTPNVLTTDHDNGLRIQIENCTVPWTVVPGAIDVCSGMSSETLATVPLGVLIAMGEKTFTGMQAFNGGGQDHLKATFSLPATAGVNFQNQSTQLDFTFTGKQRSARILEG